VYYRQKHCGFATPPFGIGELNQKIVDSEHNWLAGEALNKGEKNEVIGHFMDLH
jgi:hypothetical protein